MFSMAEVGHHQHGACIWFGVSSLIFFPGDESSIRLRTHLCCVKSLPTVLARIMPAFLLVRVEKKVKEIFDKIPSGALPI